MAVVEFPTRGRKFCPRCDAVVLTVRQLEAHIAECSGASGATAATRRSNNAAVSPHTT